MPRILDVKLLLSAPDAGSHREVARRSEWFF
jgi:hypothetical protein